MGGESVSLTRNPLPTRGSKRPLRKVGLMTGEQDLKEVNPSPLNELLSRDKKFMHELIVLLVASRYCLEVTTDLW